MNTKVILILFILLLNLAMLILINQKQKQDNNPLDGFFSTSGCNINCTSINDGNTEFCNLNDTSCVGKQDDPPGDGADNRPCKNLCHFNPLNRPTLHDDKDSNTNINNIYNSDSQNNAPNDNENHDCEALEDAANCKKNSKCYAVHTLQNDSSGGQNYQFLKCTSKTGREADNKFPDEDTLGPYSACYNKCTSDWDNNARHDHGSGADATSYYTGCKPSDCVTRCTDYLLNKTNSDLTNYEPYPTDRINQGDFDKLKTDFIKKLNNDNNLKQAIKSKLYGADITSAENDLESISTNNEKLQEIMSTLKNLNNTGNNFLQQVNQLGEFQDKYSERIDEILNSRKNDRNNAVDTKIQHLTRKIDNLNQLYQSFNDGYDIPNLDQAILQPYKQISITTGNGDVVLNLTPVQYTETITNDEGVQSTNQYYLKRQGAYLINSENPNHYLHYSRFGGADGNGEVLAINSSSGASKFKLEKTEPPVADGYEIPNVFQSYFTESPEADNDLKIITDNNRGNWDSLQKKDFYFYVLRINNIQEYNAIFLKTQGESALISSNTNIKFPFYLIESARRPGYLVKVQNNSTGNNIHLFIDKANNSPDEKFTNVAITGTADDC